MCHQYLLQCKISHSPQEIVYCYHWIHYLLWHKYRLLSYSDKKAQLEALLKTCNLTSVINFPTPTHTLSAMAIDNIFIDISKMGNYSICPIINGLSDHDDQSIPLHSFKQRPPSKKCMLIRKINEHSINYFLNKLSCESWDTIFSTDDINKMFNSFLDSYLKIFCSSFPLKRIHVNKKNKKMDYFRNLNVL